MKLLPAFYQVGGPSLSHAYDATSYLLPAGDTLYLIDCGTPEGYGELLANIRKLGFDPSRVRAILGTHGHYDHVGAAARFQADFGAKFYLHANDREQVETGDGVRTTASLLYGASFPPAKVDRLLKEGDVFETDAGPLQTLHTPGHTMGGCCFVLRHACGLVALIAADTLHGGFSDKIGSDEAVWRHSLDKLCERNFDCYTMGHCQPMLFCDANARLSSLRRSFANYLNPWFKTFFEKYPY